MTKDSAKKDLAFQALTPLGFRVHVARSSWEMITKVKHPVMAGQEASVKVALENPDEVRQSRSDPRVYLFYKQESQRRWVCAVVRRLDEKGFLITTYPTDAIKEGVRIWPR